MSSPVVIGLDVGDWLVGVVSLAVGEEVIDEHADNGEKEDNKSPEDLVGDGAVRLEDLNPSNDVENQDDESNDTATGTCLPWLRAHSRDRSCLGKHEEGELKESCNDEVEHIGGVLEVYCLKGPIWEG